MIAEGWQREEMQGNVLLWRGSGVGIAAVSRGIAGAGVGVRGE